MFVIVKISHVINSFHYKIDEPEVEIEFILNRYKRWKVLRSCAGSNYWLSMWKEMLNIHSINGMRDNYTKIWFLQLLHPLVIIIKQDIINKLHAITERRLRTWLQ